MDIDFVILWVDGGDQDWLQEKNEYLPGSDTDNRENRYRDLDNLQYWFRGVEKYASWVRKIHFVTWGHLPNWLNLDNPKLNIVRHEDYLPRENLPTFNSNALELNLHRIKGLSENFVCFNDDMYIINKMEKKDFFINGLPCDNLALDAISPLELFSHVLVNNVQLINRNFSKKETIKANFKKWFSYKYGTNLYRTFVLLPWKTFTGIKNPHLPIAFKKSTFTEVWEKEEKVLNQTSINKFRSSIDVSVWLFRYWRLLKGEFYPIRSLGMHYDIRTTNDMVIVEKGFENANNKMLCLNDSINDVDFEKVKKEIKNCFEKKLPEKSTFEI